MTAMFLTVRDAYHAQKRIASVARKTPLHHSPQLSRHVGVPAYLKLDSLQEIGSFKIRGAGSKVLNLSPAQRALGTITYSTGNHGLAVAWVAKKVGTKATICLSNRVPTERVQALKELGAEVIVHGESQDEAAELAFQLAEEQGFTMVDPIDDLDVIAGHATLGLELLEALPEVDTVLVPVSGGALISGIAFVLKAIAPDTRVIGVSMERAPVMYQSLKAGKPIELEEADTLANSLAGGIGLDNKYTFSMVQEFVDNIILVSEEQIAQAMLFAFEKHHLVVEGAGAVGIAALLFNYLPEIKRNVVAIVSGGNVTISQLCQIAQGGSATIAG